MNRPFPFHFFGRLLHRLRRAVGGRRAPRDGSARADRRRARDGYLRTPLPAAGFFIRRQARRGMVLIEVIAALTIFTLVVFALIMTLDAALDAARERNEIDAAMRGLENQLALLHASRLLPTDKDLPDDGSGIAYHLTIQPEQLQDQKKQPVAGIYRATVTAKWKSANQAEDRSVTELLYQP